MTAAALITTKTGYDLKIKIQYDAQHKIKQGITLEETTPQNQTLILINNPGENKEYPTLGCAIKEITNDNQFAHYKQLITQQLELTDVRLSKSKDIFNYNSTNQTVIISYNIFGG